MCYIRALLLVVIINMAEKLFASLFVGTILLFGASNSFTQKRARKQSVAKKSVTVAELPKATEPESSISTMPEPAKKNNRSSGNGISQNIDQKSSSLTHFYEFTQPDFAIKSIKIQHDDSGKGNISFIKSGSDEAITDPIQLSDTTIEKIGSILTELDFINSNQNYQHERDFSHLGNAKFTLNTTVRSRTAQFNYTEVKPAKALIDEYRKIGNQYIWMFDMTVARENQPLDTPRLMTAFDGYLRRGDISDPPHMVSFLTSLVNDERIPLIARNNAEKIIKQIEKQANKDRK